MAVSFAVIGVFLLALSVGALYGEADTSAATDRALKQPLQEFNSCGEKAMPIFANNYRARTCLDHMEHGASRCGYYGIDDGTESYVVFCDFNTEVGFAGTLIESIALKYNSFVSTKALYVDWPLNENSPNWYMYRLSLGRMSRIRDHSTYWRATCDFQLAGIDHRDYVRAKIADVDPVKYNGEGVCKTVDFISLRGHVGVRTTVPFWNSARYHMHVDSTVTNCAFKANSGSVSSEDNWGFHVATNSNFRCTVSANSTTQYWMGDYVKRRSCSTSAACNRRDS